MSHNPHEQLLQSAIRHHQAGQLREAEQGYRKILAQAPTHPDALHLLGVLAGQAGKADVGIGLIERAIGACPAEASFHNDLGTLYLQQGRAGEALAQYRRALELKPAYAEACSNIGKALNQQQQYSDSVPYLRRAIELNPQLAEAHSHLGTALKERGETQEAIASFQRAVALEPGQPELIHQLAVMLFAHEHVDEAITCFREIVRLLPGHLEAYIHLGTALSVTGQYAGAIDCYRRAFELPGDRSKIHYHLGITLALSGQNDEAIAAYRTAIGLDSGFADAYNNLGNILKDSGQINEAVACYRRAMECSPGVGPAHSNLLHTLTFHPDFDAAALYEEHRRWNQERGELLRRFIRPHPNDRNSERRLRIGYVSPDFRDHVVGRNMLPLFREHDHTRVEIFSYSNVGCPDAATNQIRGYADMWRDIQVISDEAAADLIRKDGIDILVDLALHLANNRLGVFAYKPAPVQMTFAGYPGTTGLAAIDYRLTDPLLDPPGADGSVYSEESLRLPNSFWCYDPLGDDVPVNGLPAQSAGQITFGCLNNLGKVNDAVLRLWGRVLQRVPGSRLVLLALPGSHRQGLVDLLAAEGIESGRVAFVVPRPRREYLAYYHQLDISLDPFPYNGHTTALDSLWMGVPVVTLVGRTVVGRAGLSQLTNLGLPELIARTGEEYVEISSMLAANLPRLANVRATLRQRMERSVLMDAPGFARGVEGAYRQIWRRWCLNPAPEHR